jgi:SAM-dependent methyltransferase
MTCRFCDAPLEHLFADLGMSPLSNSYLRADQLSRMEPFYPLAVYVCGRCFLVQLPELQSPEAIFGDYAYFSSYSESWLAHAKAYCETMRTRLALDAASLVVEIASNDGYLLQYFRDAGIPVLGIEPAANVAAVASEKGIETLVQFFGVETARALPRKADLLLGNNVLAHVPDLNDFVAGMKLALADGGTITMEFPHLLRLIEGNQFDTIYHEHFSYFSLLTVRQVFAKHGLTLVDVEELPTHGGSLRIYARHDLAVDAPHDQDVIPSVARDLGDGGHDPLPSGAARPHRSLATLGMTRVDALERRERAFGLDRLETYARFNEQVRATKRALLEFLVAAKNDGKSIAGYGAPAKGNTLLNYCGIRTDFLDYTVDRSPHKQGLFLPGTHIPIFAPERIAETKPDYVLILPWNLRDEIAGQMAHIREWGGQFVVPIPRVEVLA